MYLENCKLLRKIRVSGVFENPEEAYNMRTGTDTSDYRTNMAYPIPSNLIPVLKEMILKQELGIMVKQLSDDTNDSNNKISPQQQQ